MYLIENKTLKSLLCLGILLIISLGVFRGSLVPREASFGTTSTLEAWFSSGTLIFAKNWYRENPFALTFAMYLNPRSIEFPDNASREVYASFPPGAILPIYVAGLLSGHEPTLSLLMSYNLLNHLLIAILLSFIVFMLLRPLGIGYIDALLLSCIPIVLDLLLPAPIYHHQMGFFADQAIILPFVLFVFLEVLRDRVQSTIGRRVIAVVQGLLLFYGVLTDWLFVFVALCVYVKRLFKWELGTTIVSFLVNSFGYWLPLAIGLGLFALQLWLLNEFGHITQRFEVQTGMVGGHLMSFSAGNLFWSWHMVRGYGKLGVTLIQGSLGLWAILFLSMAIRLLFRRKIPAPLAGAFSAGFMLLCPCLLFSLFLNVYSKHPFHYFGTLKYSVPMAVVPFVLAPVALLASVNAGIHFFSPRWFLDLFRRRQPRSRAGFSLLPVVMLGLAIGYVYSEWPAVKPQFTPIIPQTNRTEYGGFLDKNVTFNDVVFTAGGGLEQNDAPLWLAYSMKRVYFVQSLQEILDKVAAIQGEYVVDILSKPNANAAKKPDIEALCGKAYERLYFRDWALERMHKQDFLEICRQNNVKESG